MGTLYDIIRQVHVPVALSCIPAFWIAVVTKKGGKVHVRAGGWFAFGMMIAAVSGMYLAGSRLGEPSYRPMAVFLIYLGTLTFVPPLHGVAVTRTRKNPERLQTPLYRAVLMVPALASLGAIAMGILSKHGGQALLFSMSPIGFLLTLGALSYVKNPTKQRMSWFYEHMFAMLAAGIAAHTAAAVFVLGVMLEIQLPGMWQIVPWVLPTIVGVPAIGLWTRKYQRKFKDA